MAKGESRTVNAIVVPLRSDVSGFSKGIAAARKETEKFGKDAAGRFSVLGSGIRDSAGKARAALEGLGKTNLGVVTIGLAGLAAAAVASAGAIAAIGFKHIGDVGKDALSLGLGAEALSRLRSVALATGTDVNDLGEFIKGLTDSVNNSIGKSEGAAEAFKKLGTSAEELSKMTPDEQIKKLNRGFASLPKGADGAAVAFQMAGQNGVKMFRMLSVGSKKFDDAFNEALVVTDDDVSEIRKLQNAIDRIAASVQSLADTFATVLVPAITSVADVLAGFATKFGIIYKDASKPIAALAKEISNEITKPIAALATPAGGPGPVGQKALDDARKARAEAKRLQDLYDKQAEALRRDPGKIVNVPTPNGMGLRKKATNQKERDKHTQAGQELGEAKDLAERLANESKGQTGAMTDAMRLNKQLMADVAGLKQDYRVTIEGGGRDEIHRRVDQIKGLSGNQRKELIQQGYQAREAGKSSGLRDELQESTKLPMEKLAEDLQRIGKMAKLGPENGGLSKVQALRAAAMKTQEAGVAGGQVQFAGATQANSQEGRSYLLSQMQGKPESMLETAKKGLEATMQGNGYLSQIAQRLGMAIGGGAVSF